MVRAAVLVMSCSAVRQTVYGDVSIPDAANGNGFSFEALRGADDGDLGLDDNYAGYFNTLGWSILDEAELGNNFVPGPSSGFTNGGLYIDDDAQALLAEGMVDGQNTLILTFRAKHGLVMVCTTITRICGH